MTPANTRGAPHIFWGQRIYVMGGHLFRIANGRSIRAIPPKRAAISHLRRDNILATACDLSEEVYHPALTEQDAYVLDLSHDVRVALGQRSCRGKLYNTVAFCGTDSLNDWLYNLMMWMVWHNGTDGRVHAGFCRKWRAVRSKVICALSRLSCRRILITGHSLGGALATIATSDIARELPHRHVYTITFGSPRCADVKFHSRPRPPNLIRFIRCVHSGDFVQLFPPLPGYVHPGCAEVVIVGPDRRDDRDISVEGQDCELWLQLQRTWRGRFRLEHHQMFAYRRAIALGDVRASREGRKI